MILPNALYMVEALQRLVHAQYKKVWAKLADNSYHVPINEKSIAELGFQPYSRQLSCPGGHGRALCCALCWHPADSRRFLSNISPSVQLHWSERLVIRLQWHHQCHTSRHSLFLRSVPAPCDSCQDVCMAHFTSGTSQDGKTCLFFT